MTFSIPISIGDIMNYSKPTVHKEGFRGGSSGHGSGGHGSYGHESRSRGYSGSDYGRRYGWGRPSWGYGGVSGWDWGYPYGDLYPRSSYGYYPLWTNYWYGGKYDTCSQYADSQCAGNSYCYDNRLNACINNA